MSVRDDLRSINKHFNLMSESERKRLQATQKQWDFYEGYHWQDIDNPDIYDKPLITENYCQAYVNKFVAFELGLGFSINANTETEDLKITAGGLTIVEYLDRVWSNNERDLRVFELGQAKSVNGDAWVQVGFESPEDAEDPYQEYSKGRIRITVLNSGLVYPTYDPHDKDKLVQVKIMYPIVLSEKGFISRDIKEKEVLYSQVWTKNTVSEYHNDTLIGEVQVNPYNIIPFVQIKNFPLVGRSNGMNDLDSVIPMNIELNFKVSDISEIIDYHAAPITVIFGAKVNNLQKGANKIWGGLPKDAKVENLTLGEDLTAATSYIKDLKRSMNEVAGVPQGSLSGEQSISNTSGVALHFSNASIIERTRVKKSSTAIGLSKVNKMILYISVLQNIIYSPEQLGVSSSDFYNTSVKISDTMPKDSLIELQQIEQEMSMGLEDRKGAMSRLGRENIEERLRQIDAENKRLSEQGLPYSRATNAEGKPQKTNSGLTNVEITDANNSAE